MNTSVAELRSSNHARTRAHIVFGLILLACVGLSWKTLTVLFAYTWSSDSLNYVPLIPLVSAFFLFREREQIFSVVRPALAAGAFTILVGLGIYIMGIRNVFSWQGNQPLSLATLGIVLILLGGFLASYGIPAARAAHFSLLFLLLFIPIPDGILTWIIHFLQIRSTDLSYLLFKMTGTPVVRHGFLLTVPTVTIEVAVECSGIHSSIALFITSLLVTHFFLKTPWKIALFMFLVIPFAVIKNAVRIVTLTLLSIHVNPGFLHGRLHHQGGFVFFLLGLLLFSPVFFALERSEHHLPASQA
jgi:exosortase